MLMFIWGSISYCKCIINKYIFTLFFHGIVICIALFFGEYIPLTKVDTLCLFHARKEINTGTPKKTVQIETHPSLLKKMCK